MNQSSNPILPITPQKPKKSHTGRIVLLIIFSPIIAVILFIGWTSIKGYVESNIMQRNALQYLQEKYNGEFVVENYRVETASLGNPGIGCFDAHPKDDASLQFDLCVSRSSGQYTKDEYMHEVWSAEERDRLSRLIDANLGSASYSLSSVYIGSYMHSPLYKDSQGKPPAFASIAQKGGYFYTARLNLYELDQGFTKDDINRKIFSIINAIKQVDIKDGEVTVFCMKKAEGKVIYKVKIPISQTDSVNKVSDINQYYR